MLLRKTTINDLKDLLDYRIESMKCLHHPLMLSIEDQIQWLAKLPKNCLHLTGFSSSNAIVGFVQWSNIDWVNRSATASWGVLKQYRRMGWGEKIITAGIQVAFDVLNLQRLDAEILATNEASIACAEKCGWEREGSRRGAVEREGRRINSLVYGMLRESYEARNSYASMDKPEARNTNSHT